MITWRIFPPGYSESKLAFWFNEDQRAELGREYKQDQKVESWAGNNEKKRDVIFIRMVFNKKKGYIFEERSRGAEATDCKKGYTYVEVVAAKFEEAMFKGYKKEM